MWVTGESFDGVCAFINGFDVARDFGPLMGFQEWMVLRRGSGLNVHWAGLVRDEALGSAPDSEFSPDQNRKCIEKLGALLAEFFEERRRRGVTGILHEHAKWLLRQKWYDGPLRRK